MKNNLLYSLLTVCLVWHVSAQEEPPVQQPTLVAAQVSQEPMAAPAMPTPPQPAQAEVAPPVHDTIATAPAGEAETEPVVVETRKSKKRNPRKKVQERAPEPEQRIDAKSKVSQDMVTRAIAFIQKQGIPEACQAFQNDRSWVQGEIFPWIFDTLGNCYVYGLDREILWKNFGDEADDKNAHPFIKQMTETAKVGGFINFFWNNSYSRAYVKSITVGKKQFIVGAGQFPISPVYIVDELINAAIAYMKKTSVKELIERINNPTGVFVRGGINLKMYTPDGTCVADGEQLAFVGQNMIDATTADGKFLIRDIIKLALDDGQGWYDFVGQSGGEPARIFAKKIMDTATNKPYILACGYYTKITDQTVISLVKKGANFLRGNGREIAFREFSTQNDKFVKGNVNIVVYDMKGNSVADSANPAFVGLNLINTRDSAGKPIVKAILETAEKYGKGWVANTLRNSYQVSYVEKVQVPDGDYVIGAAYFPVSKEDHVRFMVEDAALVFKAGAFEKTLRNIVTANSDFVRGDLSIFVYTDKGICLADGYNVMKIWANDSGVKDQNGVSVVEKIVALGKSGGGWTEFKLNNATCRVFVKAVDISKQKGKAQNIIVGSAYYP